jgi:hypothetical protein
MSTASLLGHTAADNSFMGLRGKTNHMLFTPHFLRGAVSLETLGLCDRLLARFVPTTFEASCMQVCVGTKTQATLNGSEWLRS